MTDRRSDCLLRLPEVRRRTGFSTTTIYRKEKAGAFPRKLQLSANVVAWYKSEVSAWIGNPMGWSRAAA